MMSGKFSKQRKNVSVKLRIKWIMSVFLIAKTGIYIIRLSKTRTLRKKVYLILPWKLPRRCVSYCWWNMLWVPTGVQGNDVRWRSISIKTIRHIFLQCIILVFIKCTDTVYLCMQLLTYAWIISYAILFSIKSCWVVRIEYIYTMIELNTVDIRHILECTFLNFEQNVYFSLTWK